MRRVLILLITALAADVAGVEPLRSVAAVRALSRTEAERALPVQVHGVVMWQGSEKNGAFVIHDGEQGIWVDVNIGIKRGDWQGGDLPVSESEPGAVVDLEGVTHPGGYAPIIIARCFKRVGTGPLPEAREVGMEQLLSGSEDCQHVLLRGVVRDVVRGTVQDRVFVTLMMAGHPCVVRVEHGSSLDKARRVDALVQVPGLLTPVSNIRAEMVGLSVMVMTPEAFKVLTPPPADPFHSPHVPLDRLLPFSTESGSSLHRKVTQGMVSFALPNQFFFIQEGNTGVRVQSAESAPKVGERVEVAGFVETTRGIASLSGALVRGLGSAVLPEPEVMPVDEIFNPKLATSWDRPLGGDKDAHLIRLRVSLDGIERNEADGMVKLLMQSEDRVFEALLPGMAKSRKVLAWKSGSEVEVTGVCELNMTQAAPMKSAPKITSFQLWLRGPEDLKVLRAPSWWDSTRLTIALSALSFVLVGALTWVSALQRSVRRRTQRLEEVMRRHRDSEISFQAVTAERQRLAVDLHDGLQQMIAGAAFRLEAAMAQMGDVSPAAQEQFTAARKALVGTQTGLHDCLWGLREVVEGPGDFAALLRHAAVSMDHWPPEAVVVETHGEIFTLSRDVMGSLLMLMQEAVGNAFKHGQATHVRLILNYDATGLEMRIEDDGLGFDPATAPSTKEGHFGLEGMRQRMQWLGGTVEITSAPGHGTLVRIHLSRENSESKI